jgi:flavin reductase (DIM6/NTAB) family NADH-FMN oxidoreductase RutF
MSEPRSVSSYFAAPDWEPVCVVGSHDGDRVNAQICVSIFGASIVPERPRLLVLLWKVNYTHDLVREAGTLAITLLSRGQHALLEPLGLRSGRDVDGPGGKLETAQVERTSRGDPYFPDCVGYLDCTVIDSYDLGDCTCFVVAVEHEERLSTEEPMTWAQGQELAGEDFIRAYERKFESDQDTARQTMRWLRELRS